MHRGQTPRVGVQVEEPGFEPPDLDLFAFVLGCCSGRPVRAIAAGARRRPWSEAGRRAPQRRERAYRAGGIRR